MSWGGLDQRAFPRVQTPCDIYIHGIFDRPIHSRTENIGGGGVCVILKEELIKLSDVRLSVHLEKDEPPLQCAGRVVWVVRSKEPATGKVSFDTGIEFTGLKTVELERIIHFVETRR